MVKFLGGKFFLHQAIFFIIAYSLLYFWVYPAFTHAKLGFLYRVQDNYALLALYPLFFIFLAIRWPVT